MEKYNSEYVMLRKEIVASLMEYFITGRLYRKQNINFKIYENENT
jgi:hypothetical protein